MDNEYSEKLSENSNDDMLEAHSRQYMTCAQNGWSVGPASQQSPEPAPTVARAIKREHESSPTISHQATTARGNKDVAPLKKAAYLFNAVEDKFPRDKQDHKIQRKRMRTETKMNVDKQDTMLVDLLYQLGEHLKEYVRHQTSTDQNLQQD